MVTDRSCAPAQHCLGTVASGTFPHDVVNVHLHRVFRKLQLGGDQLVGQAELQFRKHVLLAGREVDYGFLHRIFRDVTGESPTELREREHRSAHRLEDVPHCFVKAAHRPDLTIAVLEKRRREAVHNEGGTEK